ncbi:hypothetical protein BU14_0663s0004 [Porphyra umbilicalis]|uniref:Uncharacterized protein n=1 Tax=Porphyra umbilicalis TaxID=2786 RepID=A0A1X6NQE6_PORUM|nr:hypothetical protein BU14_0663s0004 [Porphyra umbilicalis]|eukprot:OSX70821.1 hypothetical protein BU14_0663s0004 [Porphyra umbilicalis]
MSPAFLPPPPCGGDTPPPPPRRLAAIRGYTLTPLARRVHIDSLRGAPLPPSGGGGGASASADADADAVGGGSSSGGGGGGGGLRGLTPSQLVVGALLAVAADRGATTAVALAIDDEAGQHAALSKWMRRNGAAPVRRVGDGWRDVPDRLVWGGGGSSWRGGSTPSSRWASA